MIRIERWRQGRHWAVWCGSDLVCVCVYKRGAADVARRLGHGQA